MSALNPGLAEYPYESRGLALRGGVAAGVLVLHLSVLGVLLLKPSAPQTVEAQALDVVFIAPPEAVVPPPPPPPRQETPPPLLQVERPVLAAPEAPQIPPEPQPELPPVPAEPVSTPAPPAVVPLAAPPQPVAQGQNTGIQLLGMPRRPPLLLPNGVKTATVRVLVRVDERGRVQAVSLVASSGYDNVDQRGLRDARDARYKPAMKNGEAVADEAVLPIKYEDPRK